MEPIKLPDLNAPVSGQHFRIHTSLDGRRWRASSSVSVEGTAEHKLALAVTSFWMFWHALEPMVDMVCDELGWTRQEMQNYIATEVKRMPPPGRSRTIHGGPGRIS